MKNKISIKITTERLNMQVCYDLVNDDSSGGIALFVGTVRNITKDKRVNRLDFSSYESMAEKEMKKIALQTFKKYDIIKIAIHHALGKLQIGDIPVIIAVSSAHRAAAFDACQYTIDTLKQTVPIWKKEYFDDGEVWVNAHP
jgi:molybdopterin synthase catalytic subunit